MDWSGLQYIKEDDDLLLDRDPHRHNFLSIVAVRVEIDLVLGSVIPCVDESFPCRVSGLAWAFGCYRGLEYIENPRRLMAVKFVS